VKSQLIISKDSPEPNKLHLVSVKRYQSNDQLISLLG